MSTSALEQACWLYIDDLHDQGRTMWAGHDLSTRAGRNIAARWPAEQIEAVSEIAGGRA